MLLSTCRIALAAFTLAATVLTTSNLNGQLIDIRPGYVRAPFVRVYSGPNGTYVRAPFVSRFTPAPGAPAAGPPPAPVDAPGPYVAGNPAQPRRVGPRGPAVDLSELDGPAVWQLLHDSAEQLATSLDALPEGKSWRNYLRAEELRALPVAYADPLPDDLLHRLRQLLRPYNAALNTPGLRRITELAGFVEVQSALATLTKMGAEASEAYSGPIPPAPRPGQGSVLLPGPAPGPTPREQAPPPSPTPVEELPPPQPEPF